jgi:hypothetical protein
MKNWQTQPANRRRMLKFLAAAGAGAPAALAQSKKQISPEILQSAEQVVGEDYSAERLKVIHTALQRNLDQFQIVRDFKVDDSIEPAPMFLPRRYRGGAK